MNDEQFEQRVRETARRIADADRPAPRSLHARVAGIPAEHPRPIRRAWSGMMLPLAGAAAALVVVVVVAALIAATLPRKNALVPGTSSIPSPSPSPIASPAAPASRAPGAVALPDGLTNRAWVEMGPTEATSPYAAGMLDDSAHLELPANERPLGVSGNLVVSLVSLGATGKDELIVRDVTAGAVVSRAAVPAQVVPTAVAMAPDTLYFLVQSGPTLANPAVYRLDLSTGFATPFALNMLANVLVASPSGRTLVACGTPGLGASAVTMMRPLAGIPYVQFSVKGVAIATTDTTLVTYGANTLYGYSFATQRLLWTIPNVLFERGYVTSDGSRFVIQTGAGNVTGAGRGLPSSALENRIAIVDIGTGALRDLVAVPQSQPGYHLWTEVSNDQAAVLIQPDYFPQAAFEAGRGALTPTVLDLATGTLTPHAFTLTERAPQTTVSPAPLPSTTPSFPVTGHLVGRTPLPSTPLGPLWITVADGAPWIALGGDPQGTVERIDPASGKVTETVKVGFAPSALAAYGTSLWVTNSTGASAYPPGPYVNTVQRIDTRTGQILTTVPLLLPGSLVADGSGAWVVSAQHSLVHVSSTGQVLGSVVLAAGSPSQDLPVSVAIAGGRIWVVLAHGGASDVTLEAIDPATLKIALTTDVAQGLGWLVATSNALYGAQVSGTTTFAWTRIDLQTGRVIVLGKLPVHPAQFEGVAVTADGAWVLDPGMPPTEAPRVIPFDPATGRQTGAGVPASGSFGDFLVAIGHDVWTLGSEVDHFRF
jgi:hypothetical protein